MTPGSRGYYISAEIPGIGGVVRASPEDFVVEEIAAYQPSGEGEHVFVWLEKRGLSTLAAIESLARALGVSARDCGSAGLKDKSAITRQLISFPPPVDPKDILALTIPGLQCLSATRHPHKLRTGHLRGNRFSLRITDISVSIENALANALAVMAILTNAPGLPNWFGSQRFGFIGDNAAIGERLVKQRSPIPNVKGARRRLYISAYQSKLFNEYLARRMETNRFAQVLAGDVLQVLASGGRFVCQDPTTEQRRFLAGEIAITGPMLGSRMTSPTPETVAAHLEDELWRDEEVQPSSFAHLRKLGLGTRRPLAVPVRNGNVVANQDETLTASFELPPGSYATVVLDEICKPATQQPDGRNTG